MRVAVFTPLLLLGVVTSVVAIEKHHRRHNIHSRLRNHHNDVDVLGKDARALLGISSKKLPKKNKLYAAPLRFKSVAGDGDDGGETTTNPLDPSVPVIKMDPMPGMKDKTIYVRAPGKYDKSASVTRGYVAESQLTSMEKIKQAIDTSEDRIKGLKLRTVEKQNFLDSLRKRERMLDADVSQDQNAIKNMLNHIDALDLRLTRLKKEEELKQLSAMYDNYTSKAVTLEGQAAGLSNARDALFNRIQSMHNTIGGLRQREDANARMAVDGDDETLQTYGYAGALKERKEALEDEMSQQMQQMALQQQMLQQQLATVAGANGAYPIPLINGTGSGSGAGAGSGSGSGSGAGDAPPEAP